MTGYKLSPDELKSLTRLMRAVDRLAIDLQARQTELKRMLLDLAEAHDAPTDYVFDIKTHAFVPSPVPQAPPKP